MAEKKAYYYRVIGTVKKGGVSDWECDVVANNAKVAKAAALKLWNELHPDKHLFRPIVVASDASRPLFDWLKTGHKGPGGKWVRD